MTKGTAPADPLRDALTGVDSRVLFLDRLTHRIARWKRNQTIPFALLYLDLDRYKTVKEELGEAAGEQLLIRVAARLRRCVRADDTLARLAEDEFGILLEEPADATHATLVAQRIQEVLSEPLRLEQGEVYPTACIGIALSAAGYREAAEMLRDAEIAMKRAKGLGRSRYVVFQLSMRTSTPDRLDAERELRRAAERGEFQALYQPVVDLSAGRLSGFEPQLTWRHPDKGPLAADRFRPIAERMGFLDELERWLIREACREAGRWPARGLQAPQLVLSIVSSGHLILEPGFDAQIELILAEAGLEPSRLRLAVPERVLIEQAEASLSVLERLRRLRMGICLDGYGAGWTSLNHLVRFPLTHVKIHPTLTTQIEEGGPPRAILEAIIGLTRKLGMHVIADGVAGPGQLAGLRAVHCECAQGPFFSAPLDNTAVAQLIRSDPVW